MELGLKLKIEQIKKAVKAKQSMLIAFSGGVDSSVVAALAFQALGEKALAVTVDSETLPPFELENAIEVARKIGIQHRIVKYNELNSEEFRRNPHDRCYYCKRSLLEVLTKLAREEGFNVIADGTNADDYLAHRPGIKALREFNVFSPLAEFSVSKAEVRAIARELNLPNADKPSMACTASRFPYGLEITKEKLDRVKQAEMFLFKMGFKQVRVRDHDGIARIEVLREDNQAIIENSITIARELRKLGYKYITLDLEGYRPGSLDEVLSR
ncbi:MAG: ATP-dependent sacrificial sulfur transferase LarE [Methanocellales archaeon]